MHGFTKDLKFILGKTGFRPGTLDSGLSISLGSSHLMLKLSRTITRNLVILPRSQMINGFFDKMIGCWDFL